MHTTPQKMASMRGFLFEQYQRNQQDIASGRYTKEQANIAGRALLDLQNALLELENIKVILQKLVPYATGK